MIGLFIYLNKLKNENPTLIMIILEGLIANHPVSINTLYQLSLSIEFNKGLIRFCRVEEDIDISLSKYLSVRISSLSELNPARVRILWLFLMSK